MRTAFPLLVLLCLCACSRPRAEETFISSEQARDGVYEFPLDFSDSTASFRLSFYARRDVSGREPLQRNETRLLVNWIDPTDSLSLSDTVYMDMGDFRGVVAPYRNGVNPEKKGMWRLRVEIDEPLRAFRGLGVVCERNGTR